MHTPLIAIVILNTNRREDTLACLESLAHSTYPRLHTIVLDNASTDGSAAAIQAAYPAVELISLAQNQGYAGNNNVGIAAALAHGAEWVLVLNEDTILAPECLEELARVGESNRQIGIVGPMIYHFDEPNMIQSAGGQLSQLWEAKHLAQNEPDSCQFVQPHDVDWVSGCAIMVRREVIQQVGGLDERFFYYWEETEWCIRTAKHHWRIVHAPQAKIWHKGVQRAYQPKPAISYYSTRNRLFALKKHGAPLRAKVAAWSQIARTITSMSLRPKWRASHRHRDAMLQGVFDFLRQRWGAGPF